MKKVAATAAPVPKNFLVSRYVDSRISTLRVAISSFMRNAATMTSRVPAKIWSMARMVWKRGGYHATSL